MGHAPWRGDRAGARSRGDPDSTVARGQVGCGGCACRFSLDASRRLSPSCVQFADGPWCAYSPELSASHRSWRPQPRLKAKAVGPSRSMPGESSAASLPRARNWARCPRIRPSTGTSTPSPLRVPPRPPGPSAARSCGPWAESGTGVRRSLVLILQDAAKPRSVLATDWTPAGLCRP